MSTGYTNIAELRARIVAMCAAEGLDVRVDFSEPSIRRPREVQIQLLDRLDVDPTEESNAVSWINN
jgi:hypothetical protein